MAGENSQVKKDYLKALETGDEQQIAQTKEQLVAQNKESLQKLKDKGKKIVDIIKKAGGIENNNETTKADDKESGDYTARIGNKLKEEGNKLKESIKNTNLSKSFYRDLGAALTHKPGGNVFDEESATAARQAEVAMNAAAKRGMEAQSSQQIANRNEYSEAGKTASMQNDAENRQSIQNREGLSGSAAAALRKTNTPDVAAQRARQDQQRSVANQQREKQDEMSGEAAANEGLAREYKIKSRDFDRDTNNSYRLSMGQDSVGSALSGQESEQQTQEPAQEPEPEKVQEPAPEPVKQEPEQAPAPAPAAPAPAPEPVKQEPAQAAMPSGNPQHVINALLGSSKGEDLRSGSATQDKELYDYFINQGVTPLQAGKHANERDVNTWESEFIQKNGEKGKQVMQALRQGRVGEGNDAARNFSKNEMNQMKDSMDVGSDSRIKHLIEPAFSRQLSDLRLKFIKDDYEAGRGISPEDFAWLASISGGKFSHGDREYDFFNDDDWGDDEDGSVLKGYAEHIRNYLYTYKPEATEIDSSIDVNEEHIGPMAQDIEQVNPACVKETPEGVKTVDAARLAMMNAGAIGDIARQLQEITTRLQALEV